MSKKNYKYTLIEIVVVIGIVAIVMGLALPAFNQMINGSKVTQAAREISAAIAQARSEAIVTGRKVALVFPSANAHIRPNYRQASYGMVVYNKNGVALDLEKTPNFRWKRLPSGTVIGYIGDSNSNYISGYNNLSQIDATLFNDNKFKRIKGSSFSNPLWALTFTPDGKCENGELYFFITEGLIKSDYTVQPTNIDKTNPNKPANTVGLKLNPFTGRVNYETL